MSAGVAHGGVVVIDREEGAREEIWVPLLSRQGQLHPLFPKYIDVVSGSEDEAIERTRVLLGLHPDLRRRWAGARIVAVNYRRGFKISDRGEI